jgi:carbonic anhydrase
VNSKQALDKLASGVHKFQTEAFPERRWQFEALGHQQHPIAMFFTCADSRIVPNLILQTEPGEVFTERTPGNIVPKYSEHVGGVTASMEFAIVALQVPLLIVCGHTDCGIVKALLEPEKAAGMPAVQTWMRHALPARERLICDHGSASREEKLRLLTEYNVLAQVENLKTHPAVESRLAAGKLEVQGWIYDIANGTVFAADPQSGLFKPLAGTSAG